MIASLLETAMLICWGCCWPFQIAKTYRTKKVEGKSIQFCWLIWLGYVFGIISKYFFNYNYVIWIYLINISLVSAEIFMYYKYRKK